jgi:teichoic acid transport system permease protein
VADVSVPPAGLLPLGGRPRVRDYLRWMWDRREFTYALASAHHRSQHMDTVLGNLWQLINPVLLIGVYYFVFGFLFGNLGGDALPWRPANYIGFLSVGVFVYSYLQRSITAGASSIVGNVGLIRSLQFPRAVLPVSVVLQGILGFASSLVVMILVMLVTGEGVQVDWLWFPAVFVLMTAFALGGALVTARWTEGVRDVVNLLPFVFRLGFYVSGILYDISRFTRDRPNLAAIEDVFLLNPFYVYISLSRESLMASHGNFAVGKLWLSGTVWAVLALTFGLRYFVGAEKRYGRG